jgi:hypothetical protein
MSFLTFIMKKTRLSDITIDVDKDWQTKGITNIKQVAELMAKGDLVARDTSILVRIPTGPDSYVLTSRGAGKLPTWQPAGGALKYYFPVLIESSHAEAKPTVDRNIPKAGPITSEHKQAYVDAPADMIKLLTPAPTTVRTAVVVPVDRTINKTPTVGRDIAILVDGAVREPAAGGQVDETAAARDGTLNDMNLCPMTPALGDKYYLGFRLPFRRVYVYTSTAGAGNWTNQAYYWNGAWTAVAGEDDQTGQFMIAGTRRINWTMPGDWVQSVILGMNLYWIKIEIINFANQTTKPLGATAWACPVA